MTTEEEVQAELRAMLRDGATVSQLVRHTVERTGIEPAYPRAARIVRQAFGLPLGGWYVLAATESFGTGDVPDSKLTWAFLIDMMEHRPAWDTDPHREPAWFDGLPKSTFDELKRAVGSRHGLSPEGWAALGEKDRERVIRGQANEISLSEDVQLLAALAERLQQRVNELEQQPAAVGGTAGQ